MGLTNGVRELMVLIPDADPSRAWQTLTVTSKEELFELGADVFLYSIDKKNLLTKGRTYTVVADPKIVATQKGEAGPADGRPQPGPRAGWLAPPGRDHAQPIQDRPRSLQRQARRGKPAGGPDRSSDRHHRIQTEPIQRVWKSRLSSTMAAR